MSENQEFTSRDIKLLTMGRYFRLDKDTVLFIGRNQEENGRLESFREAPYKLLSPCNFKGPKGVLRGTFSNSTLKIAAHIMIFYSKQELSTIIIESSNGLSETHIFAKEEIAIEPFKVKGTG